MQDDLIKAQNNKSGFKASNSLKYFLITLSIAALLAGFVLGLQVFEVLAEFKRLGILVIIGSVISAAILLAIVKILNELAEIKSRLGDR
jgi:hypothetical protein